jgi:hypothetical protein
MGGPGWRSDTVHFSVAGLVLLGAELEAFTTSIAKTQQTAPATDTAPEQGTATPVVTDSDVKPWLAIDEQDPAPAQPWYTPARYFARQLTIEKPTLLANRELLADKVSTALFNAGFKKRGGKERFDSGTVKKALVNVTLG